MPWWRSVRGPRSPSCSPPRRGPVRAPADARDTLRAMDAYLKLLAERGLDALAIDPGFAAGLNVSAGRITCEAVTAALGLK